MEIPGFTPALVKARKKEMSENPNLTSSEATAAVAPDVLSSRYMEIERTGGATHQQADEVNRRSKLISKSPAWKAALKKLYSQ